MSYIGPVSYFDGYNPSLMKAIETIPYWLHSDIPERHKIVNSSTKWITLFPVYLESTRMLLLKAKQYLRIFCQVSVEKNKIKALI